MDIRLACAIPWFWIESKAASDGGDLDREDAPSDGGDLKAAGDGGVLKAASDGGDLDREDAPSDGGDLKAAGDGGVLKAASDGGDLDREDALSDGGDLQAASDGGDIDREDALGDLKAASDGGDIDREDARTAKYIDADGGSDGVSVLQISSPDLESLDREANTFGFPAWILLDPLSIDGDLGYDNATTAEAQTITRREDGVKISFVVADPPCPSHFNIRVPSLVEKPYLLCGRPSILCTVRNLALMSITFDGYRSDTQYYLYRVVGPGLRPSLVHLDYVSQQLNKAFHVIKVDLLPRDGDGFVLTALALEQTKGEQYSVHIFQYDEGTWTSKVHALEHHQIGNVHLYNVEKVIQLSVGELGFVDLWNGIIAFNVLDENFVPRYIPLPNLLPGNHSEDQLGLSARYFRDVIFSTDGHIKCVEIEMCWKHTVDEKPRVSDQAQKDVWGSSILYDVDLMQHQIVENEGVEETFEYIGWRFICWSKKHDFGYWRKEYSSHANDVNNIGDWGTELKELSVSFPTLSIDGHKLYILSKVHTTDLESRVIMLDLESNSMRAFSPFPTKRPDFFQQGYVLCDLFKCMSTPSDDYELYGHKALLSVRLSQLYGHKALSVRLPLLKHENILSVRRTSKSMEPSVGAPVGLQLILLYADVGLQLILLDDLLDDDETQAAYDFCPSDGVEWTFWD